MDYVGILKRAWEVTWRHKVLWVLGFFAVASNTGNSSSSANWQESSQTADFSPATQWADQNAGLLIAIAVAVGLFILVMLFLGVAARGGLVHLVNEAEEDRPVRAGDGWGVGFRYWGRTFMIYLTLGLPILALAVLMLMVLFGAGLGLASSADSASAAGALGFGGALCCALPMFLVLILAASLIANVVGELAVRYGVLDDVTFGQAIKRGWSDLWGKRGAVVMWLVMLIPGIAYNAVALVILLVIFIPAILLIVSGAVLAGLLLVFGMALLLMLPGAIYNTFYSASWTIFFRRMTGMEVVPVATNPGVASGYMPPPPSAAMPGPPAPPSNEYPEG